MGDLKVHKSSSWIPTLQTQAKLWFNPTRTPVAPDSSEHTPADLSSLALSTDPIWGQAWVQRLCSQCQTEQEEQGLQTQLTVGQVGDPYEVEADSIADKVMAMPDPRPQPQLQPESREIEEEPEAAPLRAKPLYESIYQRIQRRAQTNSRVSSDLETRLSYSKSRGTPLPDHIQAFMGPRLGVDLSPIRVHTDASSVQMNRELGAQAFAHGNHVYYGAGKGPANDHLTAHELTHTVQQGAVARAKPETDHIQRQEDPEEGPGFWGTIGGGLLGEFNEDPTLGQIGVDLIVGVIPIADQIADIRDLIAHLYYMIAQGQYQDPMRWLGLALTLIGAIPIIGSVIKSASKVILKGADEVISKMDELLDLLRRISPELADIGSFKRYLDQNWNSWVSQAIEIWNTILDQVQSGLRLIPDFVGDVKRQFEQGLAQIQQLSPQMLTEAFDTLKQRLDEVLDEVLRRMGGPPSGGAGELVTPDGMRVRVDDPEVPGRDPMRMEGDADGNSSPGGAGQTREGSSRQQSQPDRPTVDLDTPPDYANQVVRDQWSSWPRRVRELYMVAQERIANGQDLVRRMSQAEYDAIFGQGRGSVQDVFIQGTEQNRVFSIDRVYQFTDPARNRAAGYERIVKIEMSPQLRSYLSENLAPDNLPGGLKGGLRRQPRFKLEGEDVNIVIPRSSWQSFRDLIQNHTVEVVD